MFAIESEEPYHHGQMIFEEGAPGSSVFFVRSGHVEILKTVQGKTLSVEILKK